MLKRILAVLAVSSIAAPAFAAVPTGVEAVFTGLATDFGTLMGYGYTAMGVVTAGLIVFGLVKKIAHKSTGA